MLFQKSFITKSFIAKSFTLSFAILVSCSNFVAQAATRIEFAKGSFCGSYSGNYFRGKEFVLNLGRGQTLAIRNTGRGTHYDVFVFEPNNRIVRGQKVARDQINFYIPTSGDYSIEISSTVKFNSIEFCAY